MRIEEVTEEALVKLSDTELFNLRLRTVQVFNKHFDGTSAADAGTLRRSDLLERYEILRREMHKRDMHPTWETLDSYFLRHKMMEGLDPALMGSIMLEPACVIVSGDFAHDPKGAEVCDVFISSGVGYVEEIERVLDARITKQISKPVRFHFGQESVGDIHLPLFDLVLRPRSTLEKVIKRQEISDQHEEDGVCHCPDCGTSMLYEAPAAAVEIKCIDCGNFMVGAEPLISKAYTDDELIVRKPGFEETENEVRYRIREPGRFQEGSFRRIALQQSKPRVYGIIGRLKGETTTTLQALRFPKGDGWTIPKARAWVKAHSDILKRGFDFLKAEFLNLAHSNITSPDEPGWGVVDKTKLPQVAFADMGDSDKVSKNFPHHWVQGGARQDEKGRYTAGTMYLHTEGLNVAWDIAQAPQDGAEASAKVKTHLNAHRKSLGRKEASIGFEVCKVNEMEHIVGGVIYEPEVEDAQGDIVSAEEIQAAAYGYMESSQRIKVMHKGRAIQAKVLESYIVQADFGIGTQNIRKGSWWMSVRVRDEAAWEAIMAGTITGFSMGGIAREA